MKISDLLIEFKVGKITKKAQQPSRGIHAYGDSEHISGDYTAFKLGQAVAMADGSNKKLDMDGKSWHGKRKTTHPYSELENNMLKQAYKAVGASYQDINHGNMESEELKTTNTVSPVADWRK